jgi:hypothetical protein
MFPRVLGGVLLLRVLIPSVLGLVLAPGTPAQHTGGHFAGGAARPSAPPVLRPPVSRPPVFRPFSAAPPVGAFRSGGSLLLRPVPFHPHPIYPIYGYPFFGPQAQFWWFWAVWSYNPCVWMSCCLSNASYNGFRFYEFNPGELGASAYSYSLYLDAYGRELPQLFLNDGSVYSVTDYWLADNLVHFKTFDERHGKPVEQAIPLDALDLQTSFDVNTKHGFRFVLRDEPMEQYLRHHPDQPPPDWTPPRR